MKPITAQEPNVTENTEPLKQEAEPKDESITIEEFAKVQLMVGTIEQCEEIEHPISCINCRSILVQLGVRQILSGVRKHFSIEDLIGKQAVFVVNFKPRKMIGLESQGMMLTVEAADKNLSVLSPQIQVPNGTKLK